MPPLVVSLFQIYFAISNNQTITVSPALEVAPVQKQSMYIRTTTIKSKSQMKIKKVKIKKYGSNKPHGDSLDLGNIFCKIVDSTAAKYGMNTYPLSFLEN
jgi:hypothetical protein